MATYTDNYNLIKPTYAETADIVPLNNNFEKIDEVMHASQTSLAPAYSQTASYQPGDVVMYELNMYKCTGATSGTWDPSKWTRTTAAETGGGGSVDFDIFGEGSGSVVTITDGAEAGLAECVVEIEATQSGSGTPSPSNVRPIVGRSEVNISVSGKNKLNASTATTNTLNGVTFTVVKNDANEVVRIDVTGTANAETSFLVGTATIEAGTYIFSGYTDGSSVGTKYINYSGIVNAYGSDVTAAISETKTTRVTLQIANGAETNFSIYPMIRLSTAPEGFEPYITPEVTAIPLDRTVYGGTLDVTRGILTDTVGDLISFTSANTNVWSGVATSTQGVTRFYTTPSYVGRTLLGADSYEISQNYNTETDIITTSVDGRIIITPTFGQGKTLEEFKALLATYPFNIKMTLATPQTYTLTPEEVSTILGYNNISADSGEVSVVYVKQTAPIKPNPTGADIPLTGIEIDGEKFSIPSGEMEIIPITAGDGTTVRTFTFSKTPKFIKIYWEDTVLDGGWIADFEIVWGQPFVDYKAHARYVSYTGLAGGCASIAYPSDNKSMILTGGNAFGACNSPNGSGLIYVQY